ncbi:Vms1/Ankzf1 family peptidyl-tRNA hydrolase [Streptomyces sp. TG1A-8]|uniref:baeRF2 domain-containing protein n=1 Tax=Streptomyces sp. TG1A-8 TaxID=3051385 RepID=UPI00265C1F63|nr:Vms1/Ankzf1 family peptidyl-tRNA hydrolase [Streptomyces sp. TG1A-8]MDO0924689.1 Vms1/Ankzf1 family peptidyl-tRNA hydrolase [Streptomyces sp. TG1A-8]
MHLSFLHPLFDTPGPWATVYFGAAPNDERGAKQHELSVRQACRTLEEEGADAATVEAVRAALMATSPAEDPAGRVFFATGGQVVLSHRLSRPPRRPIACWAPLPRLTPLLELSGQDPVCLVAYIDRTGADFELRGATGPQDAGQVEGQRRPVHRTASAEWNERHFQLKVENTWEHNAGEIAEALASAYEECGADLVVLAGDPRERRAVHERLPGAVREVTAETEHGGRAAGSSSPALEAAVERARQQHLHHHVEEVLDRFRAGRVGTDRATDAVEGVPALVEAAREHRIDTLLVRPDGSELAREAWVGAGPDQVATRRTDAQALGESDPVLVRADDALLRAAAVTAADVLVVPVPDEDEEDPGLPTGGLGALLRWTYEPATA